MSIWRDATGNEVVVCDMCGITENGWFIHDTTGFTQVDLTAEMLKAGFPQGTALECRDICPSCMGKADD
jgi:hypothetical protein